MTQSIEPYMPRRRKFSVITLNGESKVEAQNIEVSDSFVIFSDGEPDGDRSNVQIYSASYVKWVRENNEDR